MTNLRQKLQKANWKDYLQSVILLVLATFIGELLRSFVVPSNIVMLYLLAVVIASGRWGYGPAILTSFLSVFVFNFFFIPHQYTFLVTDAQDVLTFIGLFVVGVTIADLTHRVQQQMLAAQQREAQTAELYALSRDLVATIDEDTILQAVLKHIEETFDAESAIFLCDDGVLGIRAQSTDFVLDATQIGLAQWAFSQNLHAGCGTDHDHHQDVMCIPLSTIHEKVGVLLLKLDRDLASQTGYRHLLHAFANQTALAIEAAHLAIAAQQTQLLKDREQMQTILLNSISHDLRTPLVSIAGALSTLRDKSLDIPESAQDDMLDGAWEEVQRLNRTVSNLLDMTRLQSGAMSLKRDWFHVHDLIASARSQLGERLKQRDLIVDVPSDLPLVEVDLTLIVQVIVNLLDNAIKYSDKNTSIEIHAFQQEKHIIIDICDQGNGIPEENLPYIFQKFYRAHRDGGAAGTGLGLSICEGIITMHEGTISAQNRADGGSRFRITLPMTTITINELSYEPQN